MLKKFVICEINYESGYMNFQKVSDYYDTRKMAEKDMPAYTELLRDLIILEVYI